MFKPALVLIAALAGPSAIPTQLGPPPEIVTLPPAEFQGMPHQPFMVVVGTPAEVHAFCAMGRPVPPGRVILACTLPEQRIIVFPHVRPGQEAYAGRLWMHELAHLPGLDGRAWRHEE